MRRLRIAAVLLALAGACGCSRRPSAYDPGIERRPMEYPNRRSVLPSFIRMNDGRAPMYFRGGVAAELGSDTWRWTGKRALLAFPLTGETDGYRLSADLTLPPFTFDQTGPVAIAFSVNGHLLDTVHYDTMGQKRFEHPVPADWLRPDADNEVTAEIDAVAHETSGLERGFILTAIGFVKGP